MTCIVGIVENDRVLIGGDSAGIGGLALTVRADAKVFRNGPMVFGFTSSFRMGQLLRWALNIPDHDPRMPVEKYMTTVFIDAVRDCLKSHGNASKTNEVESGGTFLVGFHKHLFCIQDDYQVAEAADGFDAVGCGYQIAQGALYATKHLPARDRLVLALEASERYSAGVRGPFHFEESEP